MKIPVTIFSGFLGAGKTTLICDLVKQRRDERLAIVVNEFGSVSIDGQILANEDANSTILNVVGGLVGYDDDNDSTRALLKIAAEIHPDRLVVETSGLAVPTGIVERLSTGVLAAHFQLDAIVTVIDTLWLLSEDPPAAAGAHREVFQNQVAAADIVILNKIDELSGEQLAEAERLVRSQSPAVRFVEPAKQAHVDASLLLGIHLHEPRHSLALHRQATGGAAAVDGHFHGGLAAHEHGLLTHTHLHEHDPGWLSFVLHSHEMQDRDAMVKAIAELVSAQPILRAKGFFRDRANVNLELQCVRDRLFVSKAERQHGEEHGVHEHHDGGQLVFIGYNLDRHQVAQRLSEATGTNWN